MRTQEAARALGISASSLRRMERRGIVTMARDLNGHRRITPDGLRAIHRVLFPGAEVVAGALDDHQVAVRLDRLERLLRELVARELADAEAALDGPYTPTASLRLDRWRQIADELEGGRP